MKEKISITLEKELIREADKLVDHILIRNRSQAIECLIRKSIDSNRSAVILCGGPQEDLTISSDVFRPTAKIRGHSVIELAVRKLVENKFKTIVIVARNKVLTRIFEILKDGKEYGVTIKYLEEKNAKGTADSLRIAQKEVQDTFLVIYGDIIFNRVNIEQLWKTHEKNRFNCTLMLTTSADFSEKGTVYVEGDKITGFIQKPRKSENHIVFSPIFLADSSIFSYSGNSLEKDVFPGMAKKGILGAFLSSEKEHHVHNIRDIGRLSKTL